MERLTDWFIDERIESGRMDLVLDLPNPLPAVITMELIGLPAGAWEAYADLFHAVSMPAEFIPGPRVGPPGRPF